MKNIDYHVFALKKIISFSENTALVSHIDGCLHPNTCKIKANTGGVIFHLPCVWFVLETHFCEYLDTTYNFWFYEHCRA